MATGLTVALGIGLLIGIERPGRHAAGVRTFTLSSLSGAVAALLAGLLAMAGAAAAVTAIG